MEMTNVQTVTCLVRDLKDTHKERISQTWGPCTTVVKADGTTAAGEN